jgi:hypothetical protein
MDFTKLNRERNKAEVRKKSPVGWTIGAAFFAALVGLLVFYYGFANKFNESAGSGSTKPTTAAQQEQQTK